MKEILNFIVILNKGGTLCKKFDIKIPCDKTIYQGFFYKKQKTTI